MTCTCLDLMDEKLKEHNGRIMVSFGFPRDGSPSFMRPLISVEKLNTRSRVRPPLAVPTFCPFCGTPYTDGGS